MKQGCYRLSLVILAPRNSFFSGALPNLWMARDALLEKISDEKRWENSDGMNNLHSANCRLTLLILQLAKCLLCFLYLVVSFSNKKNKGECKLSYVQLQRHSIVYQLKSVWTVNHGPVTIVFSVLQTWPPHLVYRFSFMGNWNMQQNVFIFMQYLFCTAEKISNVIRDDVPSTYNAPCHGFSNKCVNPC